jgi:drug/metabolite transporter (DMT)-like permease
VLPPFPKPWSRPRGASAASRVSPASRYGPLALAVVAVSFGSILVRLAEAPALTVAFYRMALAALLVAPLSLGATIHSWPTLTPRSRLQLVASGLALALHFATWIASLSYTTVAASVLLVNTTPLFTLLLSWAFLREPPTWSLSGSLLLALAGVVLVASDAPGRGAPDAVRGNLLAIAGAASFSVHHVIGRALRAALPLRAYVFAVWSAAAAFLFVFARATGSPLLGLAPHTVAALLGLALVPTLAGHGLATRSLRVVSATVVGLFLLGEPVGASILADGLFGEVPSARVLAGGALILVSLGWLSLRRRS